jgi:U3 small nucleolar RNA-associated protein 13
MLKSTVASGLSKTWKPIAISTSFYTGELLVASQSTHAIYTILNSNVIKYNLDTSVIEWELGEEVVCFCVTPNENSVLISTQKNLLQHYTVEGLNCQRTIKGHQMPVTCMACNSTGELLATGSTDNSIRVWDIVKGYCTHSFKDHTSVIRVVQFIGNFNELRLLSSSDDATCRGYDLHTSTPTGVTQDHMSTPTGLAVSIDGTVLVSCGRDKVGLAYNLHNNMA